MSIHRNNDEEREARIEGIVEQLRVAGDARRPAQPTDGGGDVPDREASTREPRRHLKVRTLRRRP
jgi:hypothetical protein